MNDPFDHDYPGYAIDRAAMRHSELRRYPEIQPDVIARHYLSLIAVAQNLNYVLKCRSYRVPDVSDPADVQTVDDLIARFVQQIKDAHLRDFGLPLEWPQSSTPPSL